MAQYRGATALNTDNLFTEEEQKRLAKWDFSSIREAEEHRRATAERDGRTPIREFPEMKILSHDELVYELQDVIRKVMKFPRAEYDDRFLPIANRALRDAIDAEQQSLQKLYLILDGITRFLTEQKGKLGPFKDEIIAEYLKSLEQVRKEFSGHAVDVKSAHGTVDIAYQDRDHQYMKLVGGFHSWLISQYEGLAAEFTSMRRELDALRKYESSSKSELQQKALEIEQLKSEVKAANAGLAASAIEIARLKEWAQKPLLRRIFSNPLK